MVELGIADAIAELRKEIEDAVLKAPNSGVKFHLDAVEVEFQVQRKAAKEGEAGIKWFVVSVGGKASSEVTQTHRVKLSLTPDRKLDISAQRDGPSR